MSKKISAFETYKGPLLSLFGILMLLGIGGTMAYYGTAFGNRPLGNISGFAWSDTIGWISFNCLNDNSCSRSPYSVQVEGMQGSGTNITFTGTTFPLSGYAWSDNVGWISFGCSLGGSCFRDSSDAWPSGPGTTPGQPQLQVSADQSTKTLNGWARACSVFQSGCSGPLRTSEYTGGWDGWISLSGKVSASNPTNDYQIVFGNDNKVVTNNIKNKFAWGADVVGWINFRPRCSDPGATGPNCDQDGVYLGDPALSVSCSVSYVASTRTATWVANITGRAPTALEYKWYGLTDGGTQYGTTSAPPYTELGPGGFNTATPPAVTYSNDTHHYYRFVSVRETGSPTWLSSGTCMDGSNPGVYVRSTIPNFDISATPDMNVEFVSGDTTKDTSLTNITITPYDVAGQPRVSPVVLSVVDAINSRSTSESGITSIKIGTPSNNVNATALLCDVNIGPTSCGKSITVSDYTHTITLRLNVARGLNDASGTDVKIRGTGGGLLHETTVKLNTTNRGTGFEQF